MDGRRQGMHTDFWWGNIFENGNSEEDGIKTTLRKTGCEDGTGSGSCVMVVFVLAVLLSQN
jgi:hypothetical protein